MSEAYIVRRGGGNGGLNFRVIGGTSAPSSPKENDIWVNTNVEVTGYAFSVDEPGKKILDGSVKTSSSHIAADGSIVSKVAYGITGYLELPENSKTIIVTSSDVNSTDVYHEFYDENKNPISRVLRSKGVTTYDVPENAAYVRLSRYIVTANSDSDKITVTIDDGIVKEGAVWITLGTSSTVEFNALKKNGIMVYPLSANQYIGGAWVNVIAKIYQSGAWMDWDVYLFDYGKQHYEWQARGWKRSSSAHMLKAPTVKTNTDGSVTLSLSATNTDTDRYPGGVYELVEDFDLTGVASLELVCDYSNTQTNSASADGFCLAVVPRSTTYWDSGAVAKVWSKKANATLDVSNVASGSYDIIIGMYLNAENYGAGTMTVTMRELKAVRG